MALTPDRPHLCNLYSLIPDGARGVFHYFGGIFNPGHSEYAQASIDQETVELSPRLTQEILIDVEAQVLADAAMRYAELNFQRFYPGRI